ncbi:MAG: NAD(P)H-binding protein [Oleispira sp.]|nr:NAD(P)H-binding protein [Oleispira sp.]MBL4881262.1 NAD(P)H-binding protein [Oleispira sp.]
MRITVFGAAGSAGSRIVTEALLRGHEVTAVVRNEASFAQLPNKAQQRQGDASRIEDVIALSKGQDLVIAATRPAEGQEKELINISQSLLTGLAKTQVRLIAVGGAGSLNVGDKKSTLVVDDTRYVSPAWRDIAVACVDQYEVYKAETRVNWTYLSPPAMLLPGERTAQFRLGKDELLVDQQGQSKISYEDLAVALIDEAEQSNFPQQRFTLAY